MLINDYVCPSQCSGPKTREGARILSELVGLLHAVTNRQGVAIDAVLSLELFDRLCLWQIECEHCEETEAIAADEDSNLADVEGMIVGAVERT